ncbi:MAG: redoxin domain-containing protein [Acidobacteria bacterium]|nr:redoxin domain-containing protein [Acidobacteriota bacterium]
MALESCKRYGEVAPGAGYALHMPGHVYATVGMWNEAAISMDSATLAEKRYMRERMIFPFNAWNHGHNRNYLNYILEQLGMADAAVYGARQMMDAPLDPKFNADAGYSMHSQGMASMVRTLVKFEQWKELLSPETIKWRDTFLDKMTRHYAEARAHLGLGDAAKAEKAMAKLDGLEKELEKNKQFQKVYKLQRLDLRARLALSRGDTLRGMGWLSEVAVEQFELQKSDNDPPFYPELLYNALGRAYLESKSPQLAAQAFTKSLEVTRNDWFALAGLVQAHHGAGDAKAAAEAMARLRYLTVDADQGLAWMEPAMATGVKAEAKNSSPALQRNYKAMNLDCYGPAAWEPHSAPRLLAMDPEGKSATLDEYKGKNVLLVFYLGRECLHRLKQLRDINGKKEEWYRPYTVVLAVSSNPPANNLTALKIINAPAARILSDTAFQNARRFRAYDALRKWSDTPRSSSIGRAACTGPNKAASRLATWTSW